MYGFGRIEANEEEAKVEGGGMSEKIGQLMAKAKMPWKSKAAKSVPDSRKDPSSSRKIAAY